MLICKILALSSPNLMSDIVNAPAEQNRDSNSQKTALRCDGEGAGVTPPSHKRIENARPPPLSPEDAARGPTVRDGRLIATPDSRDRLNGGERIRSRSRKCGLVCCLLVLKFALPRPFSAYGQVEQVLVELLSAILPSDDDASLLRGALQAVEHLMRLAPDYFFPLLLRQGEAFLWVDWW